MANENQNPPPIETDKQIEKRLRDDFKASLDAVKRENAMALDAVKTQVLAELQSFKAHADRLMRALDVAERQRNLALDELASLKAQDSDIVEGAPGERCEDPKCSKRATLTYIWPGTLKRYRGCDVHAQRAAMAVANMGSELKLTPIDAPPTAR